MDAECGLSSTAVSIKDMSSGEAAGAYPINTCTISSAYNFVQAGEIKRRIEELTENQNRLVMDIVGRHPDVEVRDRFVKLAHKIDDYRPQIKSCEDPQELKKLQKEIDEAVEEWVYQFQVIVSEIVGVKPPDSPIQGESPF